MSLIPLSGKPVDLNTNDIITPADADRCLIWLGSVLTDMETQVKDGTSNDPDWLKRLRAAQRATSNLRNRILEMRDNMLGEFSLHGAIASIIAADPDLLAQIEPRLKKQFPHLAGFDLTALEPER